MAAKSRFLGLPLKKETAGKLSEEREWRIPHIIEAAICIPRNDIRGVRMIGSGMDHGKSKTTESTRGLDYKRPPGHMS